jgi:hypothetical protein
VPDRYGAIPWPGNAVRRAGGDGESSRRHQGGQSFGAGKSPVRETQHSPTLGASGKNSSRGGDDHSPPRDPLRAESRREGEGRPAMSAAQIRRRHLELGVAEREFALLRQKVRLAILVALALAVVARATGADTNRISIAVHATKIAITEGVAADIPTV